MELKLYEIAAEIRSILETEEWTEETETALGELTTSLEAKAEGIAVFSDRLQAFVDYCKKEENRIAAHRKAADARIGNIKSYLKRAMETAGRDELQVGSHTVKIKKNPPKVAIDNEEEIPARYFTVIPEQFQLNKSALAAAIKGGEEVKGAKLVQDTRIDIK
jgi:hypothetical protein